MKLKYIVGGLCIVAIGFQSCRTAKPKTTTENLPVTEEIKDIKQAALYENVIDYKTFSGKANLRIESAKINQSVTANLKIQGGKQIWISAIAMGIAEVGRVSITPDSVQAIDRLNKNVYLASFQEGVKKLNAPIEYKMLEQLFVGNPLMENLKPTKVEDQGDKIAYYFEKDGFGQILVYEKTTKALLKQEIKNEKQKFSCTISYSNYVIVNNQRFSNMRTIQIDNAGEKVKLDMEYDKADIDVPVEISFSVPSTYTKKTF